MSQSMNNDLKKLSALNALFIKNYIAQDTVSHNEIIHEDFICIENSGAIVGRKEYMKDWATSYLSSGFNSFEMEDEFIRLFGDMALVRSKTIWTRQVKGVISSGASVYTDIYKKEDGRWWCVQAQITPIK
jgi:ketosteroid isomerase-like protein